MTTTTEHGTLTAAAKVTRILDLLRSLPMDLPEPSTYTLSGGGSELRWKVDEATARRIIAFLGRNDWHVSTYDDPHTIATRYLDATYTVDDIACVVVVDGVNLPDIAEVGA